MLRINAMIPALLLSADMLAPASALPVKPLDAAQVAPMRLKVDDRAGMDRRDRDRMDRNRLGMDRGRPLRGSRFQAQRRLSFCPSGAI